MTGAGVAFHLASAGLGHPVALVLHQMGDPTECGNPLSAKAFA